MDDEKEATIEGAGEAEAVTATKDEERAGVGGEIAASNDFFAETLASLQKERDSYYDRLLRKQAEFDNYRKRVEREKADTRFAARQEIFRELLNVLDACERGLESMDQDKLNLESYREGYGLLHRQLRSLLAKFGVEEIEAVGQQFDPNVHEAILHESSEAHPDGQVIEEIKKGYRLHDRLLRPAQVKVARTDSVRDSE